MPMRLILFSILFVGLPRCVLAQADSPSAAVDLEPMLREAEKKLRNDLRSGRGKGSILVSLRERDQDTPTIVHEGQFEIVFERERFRIDMKCSSKPPIGDVRSPAPTECRQTLLFDGKQHFLVQYAEDGQVQGLLYDRNWTEYLLEKIHFPCRVPSQLWLSAHELIHASNFRYQTKPLNERGIYAYITNTRAQFEAKCYLIPPAPLVLSRVSFTLNQQSLREFNLEWKEADGVRYVNRFSSRESDVGKSQEHYRSLEFSKFETNPEINDSELELPALRIPKGTKFTVKVPVPTTYVFDGEKLQREIKRN